MRRRSACTTHCPTGTEPEDLEQDLCFIGLAGMIDPIRPEVKAAVAECRAAGIRPVMITGDHKDTAVAIGKELGIITDASQAVTGSAAGQPHRRGAGQGGGEVQRLCPGAAGA